MEATKEFEHIPLIKRKQIEDNKGKHSKDLSKELQLSSEDIKLYRKSSYYKAKAATEKLRVLENIGKGFLSTLESVSTVQAKGFYSSLDRGFEHICGMFNSEGKFL